MRTRLKTQTKILHLCYILLLLGLGLRHPTLHLGFCVHLLKMEEIDAKTKMAIFFSKKEEKNPQFFF